MRLDRHQLRIGPVRFDEPVIHVTGMARHVPDAREAIDPGQRCDEPAQAALTAASVRAMIGIHVLAQQGDLANTCIDKTARLADHLRHRARILGTARVGYNAEGTELVTAFLHGQERGGPSNGAGIRKAVELVDRRKFRIDDARPVLRLRNHLGQAMIHLRPDNDVHGLGLSQHLLAFCLRYATGNGNDQLSPITGTLALQDTQTPQFRVDLLCCLLANVARVKDDEVCILRRIGAHISMRRHDVCHAGRVILVHLAAIRLDEDLLCHVRQAVKVSTPKNGRTYGLKTAQTQV
jgi:hypothetical protein